MVDLVATDLIPEEMVNFSNISKMEEYTWRLNMNKMGCMQQKYVSNTITRLKGT